MPPSSAQPADQQYFPTYKVPDKSQEIVLKEYDLAASTLAAEERVLNLSTSALVALIGIAAAALNENPEALVKVAASGVGGTQAKIAIFLVIGLITLSLTLYFADTRKSVVHATRKIIILRRMLGLSYGNIKLILPPDRLEGATEPYHIHMFHGWFSTKATPLYCICCTTGVVVWLIAPSLIALVPIGALPTSVNDWLAPLFGLAASGAVGIFYRFLLRDDHESFWLFVARKCAACVRQPLEMHFEHVLYRARLAVIEANRIGVKLGEIKPILVEMEDRDFYCHRGVSLRAIVAAGYRFVCRGKRSGGSTITQQIVRTLFIKQAGNNLKRKVIEILLALWIEKHLSKDDLISIYICSVRYERGVYGIASAAKHFFPTKDIKSLEKAEVFFLVERVSNVYSRLLSRKIAANLRHLVNKKILNEEEVESFFQICLDQRSAQRMKFTDQEYQLLQEGMGLPTTSTNGGLSSCLSNTLI